MATVTVRVDGIDEVVDAARAAEALIGGEVDRACADAAALLVRHARPFIHPRGGAGALTGGLFPDKGRILRRRDLSPKRSLFPRRGVHDNEIETLMEQATARIIDKAGL